MARLGGAGAVYETLAAWDFLEAAAGDGRAVRAAEGFRRRQDRRDPRRRRRRACARPMSSIAPATTASILEAARRAGGRSLTLRRGDSVRARSAGRRRTCRFDEGFSSTPGPAASRTIMCMSSTIAAASASRCSPTSSRAAPTSCTPAHIGNGRTMQVRRALYDLQGHVAELLDKCVGKAGHRPAGRRRPISKSCSEMLAKFGDLTKIEARRQRAELRLPQPVRPRRL